MQNQFTGVWAPQGHAGRSSDAQLCAEAGLGPQPSGRRKDTGIKLIGGGQAGDLRGPRRGEPEHAGAPAPLFVSGTDKMISPFPSTAKRPTETLTFEKVFLPPNLITFHDEGM